MGELIPVGLGIVGGFLVGFTGCLLLLRWASSEIGPRF